MHLSNISIRQKLFLLATLLIISTLFIAALAFNFSLKDSIESRKQQIKSIAQTVAGQVSGLNTAREKQQLNYQDYSHYLRQLIYHANKSVSSHTYLIDIKNHLVLSPIWKQHENKSLKALSTHTNTDQLISHFTHAAQNKELFWESFWAIGNNNTAIKKLTYAALIPNTNLLIATDHPIDDLNMFNWKRASGFIAITLVFSLITLLFTSLISRNLIQPLSNLSREMKKISRGEIDQTISSTQRTDELGRMARALQHFRDQQVENNRLRHMQEHVRFLESFDPVTRLYNRQTMGEFIEQEIIRNANSHARTAFLLISIDLLRNLTIEMGNDQRDQLLITTSKRLRQVISVDHRLSRMGDNSFGLLIIDAPDNNVLEDIIQSILKAIKEPLPLDSIHLQIGARIGITFCPENGDQPFELIGRAEIAASTARKKEQEWLYFSSISDVQKDQKIALWQDLSYAMEHDQFHLVFQPLYDLRTNMQVSTEVLLRWKHPTYGYISPATFVPMAEQSGLISQLDNWVLNAVAKQCALWKKHNLIYPNIAINLSGISFLKPDFAQELTRIFKQHSVSLQDIELELTEGVLIDDLSRITEQLARVKATGSKISIDDFGTGYSSLSRIKTLPVDHIKIDRSFIEDIQESPQNLKIVQAIILMAHGLQLKVIAEGVETEAQLSILRNEHCDIVQGFLLSKPLSVTDYAALLEEDLIIEGD